jgi:hypothetical protein
VRATLTTCLALAAGLALAPRAGTAAPAAPAAAPTADDYDPTSHAWNGLASLVALAEGLGFSVTPVTALEWSELSADDILILVYPLQRVDPSRLDAFVEAGGNVVLADDFGEGKDALAGMGLLRAELGSVRAERYQDGLVWAPIATARAAHPLAAEVGDLVTNHPAALTRVEGATAVLGFADGAVVVAGERGPGRFVAISDPSILINRMLQFRGNLTFATNLLRWLDRGGRARHVVLLRGDVPMYGEPRPYIDDAEAGAVGRGVRELNAWLHDREAWLLTEPAMRGVALVLAFALLVLVLVALPVRRGPVIDGAWLRFGRPERRDEPHAVVAATERGAGSLLVLACVLRDQLQHVLAEVVDRKEPLYTVAEAELVARLRAARGPAAGAALRRVYGRLRALPSRGQAAAPWGTDRFPRRDFDALYADVAELCRTLGRPLPTPA